MEEWTYTKGQEQTNPKVGYDAKKATTDFFFQLNLVRPQVNFQAALGHYLGYEEQRIDYPIFMDMIPKTEYPQLHRLHRLLLTCYESHPELQEECCFLLVHHLRQVDGKPLRFLREIRFLPAIGANNSVWCENRCTDISRMDFTGGIQFDVQLSKPSERTRRSIMRLFKPALQPNASCFSARQLEVLKIWEETDSIALAAKRLHISARTLETHLRNMRRKIGVRRTMDVLLLAKERGWL